MRCRARIAAVAAAVTWSAIACSPPVSIPEPRRQQQRLEQIRAGLKARTTSPRTAAEQLAEAGAGTVLERVRFRAWTDCLEASDAGVEAWQRALDANPPSPLRLRLLVGHAMALHHDGAAHAVDAMERAAEAGAAKADELLVRHWPEEPAGQRAARRMAVERPQRLQAVDPSADRAARQLLTSTERLQRARSLIGGGAARQAVRELEGARFEGALEVARRRALADAWLAMDQPQGALRTLPAPAARDAADLLLYAQARRRVAWQRYPRSGTEREFARAAAAAERALTAQTAEQGRREALTILAEASVEIGSLKRAWWAWRQLAAREGDPDPWLGRRLGVALARAGDARRTFQLSVELPEHRRCLRYWSARAEPDGTHTFAKLASAPIGDLYSRWSRAEIDDQTRRMPLPAVPEPLVGEPPRAVQLLLDWGERELALEEWSWQLDVRGARPERTLALADLRGASGRRVAAIRALRQGFPDLGTVRLDRVPDSVRTRYLPLPFVDAVVAAAHRTGLEPWLVAGVARQESAFVPTAVSGAGAVGLMQLMEPTARPLARALAWRTFDLTDPSQNLRLGAAELARLLTRYDGQLEPALAAYNAGPNRVDRWWRRAASVTEFTEAVPIRETYSYIRSVVYLQEAYRIVYDDLWRRMAP